MRKVKLFSYSYTGIIYPSTKKLEPELNEFLAKDGNEIKVIDVKFQAGDGMVSVLVYYEKL